MMSLATLWALVRTIDADGRSPVAEQIAQSWPGELDPVHIRSSANFVFRTGAGFLRFAHESERSRSALEIEMELLGWLANAGVRINVPLPTFSGEMVATVDTELGTFHAVLLSTVEGAHLEIDALSLPMFERWGEAVGHLHEVFDEVPERLARPAGWISVLERAQSESPLLAREASFLETSLAQVPGSYGTIHTDLELDNLLWNGIDFGLVDFDEYSSGWRALEIAKALAELGDALDPRDRRVSAFIAGYRQRAELPEDALETFPLMTRLFDLGMYLRLQAAMHAPLDQEGAARFARLTGNLQAWMTSYEDRTARYLAMSG